MSKSNQITAPDPSSQPRHQAVAHGDAEAAECARAAGLAASFTPTAAQTAEAEWLQTCPDLWATQVAELLTELGRSPEDLVRFGVSPELAAEVAGAMDRLSSPPEAEAEL